MTCPRCGTDTSIGAPFCAACGAPPSPEARAPGATGVGAQPFDVTIGPDATGFGRTTPPSKTHTEEIDADVTRLTAAGAPLATAGAFATATAPGGGGARQMQMFVAGQTLGTRYHIIRLLGVGGMGAVYHAWDAELGVAVALKVIRADVSGDPDAAAAIERQFKRELLLARQVTHKHVVRIHDLAEIDGVKYITTPYVQGADLATVLRQTGKLPVPRALKYVTQIVDGLVAAHEAGVVHRDLKPANIMIDQGDHALIMDFGIARAASNTGSGVTKVVGTLAYMAPEQAQAKPTDQRADVYSLGMMLREMLVGRTTPSDGEQALADLMERIRQAPPKLRAIDAAIPEPLESLIDRCVQPDPANRYQTSADLAHALAALDENGHLCPTVKPQTPAWRLAATAAVVVAAIGVAAMFVRRPPAGPAKPIDPVSILVADFDNKTGDAVFDGALEQPLMLEMEAATFINAAPRTTAQQTAKALKGGAARLDAQTAQLIAFREGTKFVLAGDVSPKGRGFTLRLRAIDPSNGNVVKEASADAKTKADVLPAVSTVAGRLRAALGDKTVDSPKRASTETFTAGSLEAFREYTTAQDLALARRDEEAVQHYRKAIDLDPKFGRAYSGLAVSAQKLGNTEEAKKAYDTALSLVDRMTDREKYRTLGTYYLGVGQNYEKASENYSALLAAYPTDDAALGNLALAHFYLHDFAKALGEVRRAVEINRKNMISLNNMALFAMYAGDFAAATSAAKQVIDTKAPTVSTYLPLAMDAIVRGDTAGATGAYEQMAKTGARGASVANLGKADLALYLGRNADATAELQSGLSADVQARNAVAAALKQVALAEAQLAAGARAQAIDTAHAALKATHQLGVLVPAARVLIAAGKATEARALAAELEGHLQKQNRAYAKILLGQIALDEKSYPQAIDLFGQALALSDLWLGRFDRGIAYVQAGLYPDAQSDFDACLKRRGEATALFFDEMPTVRYLAPLSYWTGRAEEGMKMATAHSQYQTFIDLRKDAASDPLVQDARRRIATP